MSLEKEREGEWECLLTGEADDEGESSAIPLRGPFADQLSSEELETLRKRIDMATNEVKYTCYSNTTCVCVTSVIQLVSFTQ